MTAPAAGELVLRNARLLDGSRADVLITGGLVAAVGPGLAVAAATPCVDLSGDLLLGAFVEPHLHLDKVFTADRGWSDGSLRGAMTSYQRLLAAPTPDVIGRARHGVAALVRNGVTTARVHIGCGRLAGTRFVEAIATVREQAAALIDLQIVAHLGGPAADQHWHSHTRLLRDALDAGADVVGGNPSLEAEPEAALDALLDVAVDRGVPIDLHLDETMDPSVFLLRRLAEQAPDSIPVTASHCVSLGQHPGSVVDEVAELLARKSIRVVTLPATNLYLQRAGSRTGGLPPLDRLLAAGVEVAAGGDNVQDPFNPTGRLDPLDTAGLLTLAAGLDAAQAIRLVTDAGRRVMDRPSAGPVAGSVADLVALRTPEAGSPLAAAGAGRRVWRRGRLVAETRCTVTGPVAAWSAQTRQQRSEEARRP
ncbi:amidohydrolase family protein [Nakamurella lactea]|uniref:amidohydrolase family protein n=1 Tax=Nakamurella lactea TaxID=459515 RepID=UPI00041AC3FE|nr:amidohydrolase family protein [Nakamurella lactea]